MIELRHATPGAWTETVLADLDSFLPDHASAEYKASGMAMSMALHYSDKPELVAAMADLAVEELAHFRDVVRIMTARGLTLTRDEKDPYVNALRSLLRKGTDAYFLDRLLVGAVIEARGAERFGLLAAALGPGSLKDFYSRITRSEDRHYTQFLDLAARYFPQRELDRRLAELLDAEAELVAELPVRARLH